VRRGDAPVSFRIGGVREELRAGCVRRAVALPGAAAACALPPTSVAGAIPAEPRATERNPPCLPLAQELRVADARGPRLDATNERPAPAPARGLNAPIPRATALDLHRLVAATRGYASDAKQLRGGRP